MAEEGNPRLDRALEVAEPGRREALRRILTAAYAAPVVASFSLSSVAEATVVPLDPLCYAANQTYVGIQRIYAGRVKCKGVSIVLPNGGVIGGDPPVQEKVDQKFDVEVGITNVVGSGGGRGKINGGASSLVLIGSIDVLDMQWLALGGDKDETVGFRAAACDAAVVYSETGQWKLSVDKQGNERLKGKSWVMMRSAPDLDTQARTSYSLECEYDLLGVPLTPV